jgi:hypothetical protein
MPDILGQHVLNGTGVSPLAVFLRLLVALALGALVAWIYVKTTRRLAGAESFPVTLALLAVLIAMVTQVIGDNVARAFSLVGALSIVRFRTVVRDTKDTAYVIFAVVVGMAVGAQNLWVALIGIALIGAAMAFVARASRAPLKEPPPFLLTVRIGAGQDFNELAAGALSKHLQGLHLLSAGTMKQGTVLEYVYETRMKGPGAPEEFVRELSVIEGVQDVRLQQRAFEQEP